jgi:hypothetical protein
LKPSFHLALFAAVALTEPGFAQKLVDPSTVAPEYREAAEKRRAEQIRMQACHKKIEAEKVLPRDKAAAINRCLEAASVEKPADRASEQTNSNEVKAGSR